MAAKVYFTPARGSSSRNRIQFMGDLIEKLQPMALFGAGDPVAVKIHWGERGNAGFLSPIWTRRLVKAVRETGARPFVTDTNTLYRGSRHDAIDNLSTAAAHGFTAESLTCPVIVADGLTGKDSVDVQVGGDHVDTARVAAGIARASGLAVLSHVKGHMVYGFGGALKNLGMGCCTAPAKQFLHADLKPSVDEEACTGCGTCASHCGFGAIRVEDLPEGLKARVDHELCQGCGECVVACPIEAIPIDWGDDSRKSQEKTAEYAWAAVQGKPAMYLNLAIDITPDCDCCSWSDAPMVPDVGFLASLDPVAVDVASIEMINKAAGRDVFRENYDIDYRPILEHAERLGMGSTQYELVELP